MIVGVLLAAGGSRRFGSPKQLALLDGQPLVLHALDRLLCVPLLEDVVVVVGAHADAVTAVIEETGWAGVQVVRCGGWAEGIAASLRAGVAAAAKLGAEAVLVHLADLPDIPPQVVAAVLDHGCDDDGRPLEVPTRATFAGVDGHPVLLPATLFPAVVELRGDVGARALLARRPVRRFEAAHLADPTDVDTREQLAALDSRRT